MPEKIRINPSKIPAVDLGILCSTFAAQIEAFFSNPENQRQFEEWKAKRDKEEKEKCLKSN